MESVLDPDLALDRRDVIRWPYEAFPASALRGTVLDRFSEMVSRFGHRVAIADAARSFTYAEVGADARRVAAAVEAAAAGRPGPVAIYLTNEARYPAAILGILACGRGYVGLDTEHPDERNRRIADHAGVVAVVSTASAMVRAGNFAGGVPVVDIDRLSESASDLAGGAGPDDIAWIIYTSGSTGEPKGVYQNHSGLLHDVMQSIDSLHLAPEDRQALFTSPSLISGARVTFSALLSGGSLHCVPPRLDARALAEAVIHSGTTVFRSVPSLFRAAARGLPERARFDALRLVLLGGDRVDLADYEIFFRSCVDEAVFGTHLGATECSTLYLQWFVRNGTKLEGRLAVGRAIPDRSVALATEDGAPVANGEIGEFVVSSRYLALGYWRDPERTASLFAVDGDDPAVRVFRTGDLGRRRSDGLYEHHGRKDQQIKLHGNRIELGDIEDALRSCQGLRDGAVVVRRGVDGAPRSLAAYVELLPSIRGLLPRHVRAMLSKLLPQAMMPSVITVLQTLPRLPNLKVDRMALAGIDTDRQSRAPAAGKDTLAGEIIALFHAVLETGGASEDDTVSSLGGDSLQAIAVAYALEERFGVFFELNETPLTIRELADRIAPTVGVEADSTVQADA